MRRPRRNRSSEFEAKIALTASQGNLTMSELVKKFGVHANQITEWKKQPLSVAPDVFKKGAQKAEDAEQTVSELHAKIGQLTMENDFLERGLTRIHRPQGKEMVTRTEPLSIIRQCDLLDLPRSTFYHVPRSISEADLELMKLIDRCHMELPLYGSRRMVDWLGDEGYLVNRKKVQRLIPRLLSERIANGAKTVLITLKACGLLLCLMSFKTICP